MIDFEVEQLQKKKAIASIKVIGVGGAGGNTVNSIIQSGCTDIECIVVNTDAQVLDLSLAEQKIQIGVKATKGLGTGTDPELGKRSAEEDLDKVMAALEGADIAFITAGMGGGTGSGVAPVIARALREKGILSIAIVTKPFLFEGKRRARVADQAIQSLAQDVDTLIVIPNQKLLDISDEHVSMIDGFAIINEVLTQSVRGISDLISKPGHINVDFADVRTIMKDRGMAVMGTGTASGVNRAQEAALKAITSPLLESMSMSGARGVLMNITGGKNLGLHEISQAASIIYELAHEDANIIIGSVIDDNYKDEVSVIIIATGFEKEAPKAQAVQAAHVASQMAPQVVQQQVQVAQAAPVVQQQPAPAVEPIPYHVEVKKELHVQPTVRAEQSPVAAKQAVAQQAGLEEVAAAMGSMDMDDLDIPTFMRQENQEG
jgi:cell division protein FtsZ